MAMSNLRTEQPIEAPVRRVGSFRWVICGLLFLAATINYVDRQVIGILKPTLQAQFGWSEIDYADIVFAFQLAYAIGFLFAGRVMDLLGIKRGFALAFDALAALLIFAAGSAVFALIASLVGGVRPQWLAGSLLGAGWLLVVGGYFVLFWSSAGQTPGMKLMRLRARRADGGGISLGRAIVRALGLALAIIPLFAGFLPALLDERRRALPDYLAGTVVVYDD